MTTSTDRNTLLEDRRRARALRWLLKLRTAHHLPMPQRIDFGQLTSPTGDGSVLRYLMLELDNDADVTGWATAVNANRVDQLAVTGSTHTWTDVFARTDWRRGPRVDWHQIQVASNHHYRPRTDHTAVTA
jgi:hypothetical protein